MIWKFRINQDYPLHSIFYQKVKQLHTVRWSHCFKSYAIAQSKFRKHSITFYKQLYWTIVQLLNGTSDKVSSHLMHDQRGFWVSMQLHIVRWRFINWDSMKHTDFIIFSLFSHNCRMEAERIPVTTSLKGRSIGSRIKRNF